VLCIEAAKVLWNEVAAESGGSRRAYGHPGYSESEVQDCIAVPGKQCARVTCSSRLASCPHVFTATVKQCVMSARRGVVDILYIFCSHLLLD
jgi:hypothetical protein